MHPEKSEKRIVKTQKTQNMSSDATGPAPLHQSRHGPLASWGLGPGDHEGPEGPEGPQAEIRELYLKQGKQRES